MIEGMKKSILDILQDNHLWVFYLTGSRFFGNEYPDSDWDFFAEDSSAIVDFLVSHGFSEEQVSLSSVTYADTNTAHVYKFANVHVQLVTNLDMKIRQQTFLTGFPFFCIDKRQRKLVWDWVLQKVR